MNIGFDGKRALFNKSGLGNYSRNVVNALARYYPSNNYYLYSPLKQSGYADTLEPSVKICYPGNRWFNSIWRSYFITKTLVHDGISLYHGLSNEIPFTLHKAKIPALVTIHDIIFLTMPEMYAPADRLIYHKKFIHSCTYSARIIAASQQTKNDIIQYCPAASEKIDVVYQPVSRHFHTRWTTEQLTWLRKKYNLPGSYLLTVGTIEKRKNLLNIIKAIHENKIILPLIVIGQETPYIQTIKDYIALKHLDKQILFIHGVSDEELPGFYQQATLFLYISLYEGFGIPVLEALVSGVPVITSKGGCLEETGGNAACYTTPQSSDAIGSSIIEVLSDQERMKKMIALGITHAGRFSEQRIATDLTAIYNKTIKQGAN